MNLHEEIWLVDMSGDDFDRRFDVVAETRRRWSLAEKRKIVAEACVPCANVSAVARRHGVKPALLYRWKKELGDEVARPDKPPFVPVTIAAQPVLEAATEPPAVEIHDNNETIDIRLANGRSVRVDLDIDTNALKRIINALDN